MEEKNKRKEPLTTIAVNKSTISCLDDYLMGKNISRKQFVEKAISYFIRTGYNLEDDISSLSPVQNAIEDLREMQLRTEKQNTEVLTVLTKMFEMQKYVQKALPEQSETINLKLYKDRYDNIKKALLQLNENKVSVRIGKIKYILNTYCDL